MLAGVRRARPREPCLHHAAPLPRPLRRERHRRLGLAFAYEALARGHAVAGDAERARTYTEQALAAAEDIAEDEDRELLLGDLEIDPRPAAVLVTR